MPDSDLFSVAQRGSIGVCIAQLSELLQTVRSFRVEPELVEELEETLQSLERATEARLPAPPRNRLTAALVQMLVLEEELRPKRLSAYGAVQPEAAIVLDQHIERLTDLTNAVIDRLERPRV
jgi:hypothetical protein